MMIQSRCSSERSTDDENLTSQAASESSHTISPFSNSLSIRSKSVPLNELLEKIPLAYSPLTKQLHIIYPNEETSEAVEDVGVTSGSSKKSSNVSLTNNYLKSEEQLDDDMSNASLQEMVISLGEGDGSSLSSETSHQLEEGLVDDGNKRKKKGISSFFSRSVFLWKNRDSSASQTVSSSSSPGWRLFSKSVFDHSLSSVSPNDEDITGATSTRPLGSPTSLRSSASSSKRYEDVVASSSALILHDRPANLPAKSVDEEAKHKQEYEQMVEAAKKKERHEARIKKKQMQQQIKTEERLAHATKVWLTDILPKWNSVMSSRKIRNLWWQGIPPCVRGKVWLLAIGNELNVTPELYEICVTRAQELLKIVSNSNSDPGTEIDNPDRQASVELIQLDISRTFPQLCIFQKGGPYYDILHSLLGAYACYRPDIGYVQGMSFLAAILILNMEETDAFVCFANLLNRPCHMAFFRLDQSMMQAYYSVFEQLMADNLPKIHSHFVKSHLSPDLYLLDWIYTVFAKAMPLDVACRVWDVFLRDGEEFLFRTALGVLHLYHDLLLGFDFLVGAQFLTKLPEDLNADSLFLSIQGIRMQRYSELLTMYRSLCIASSGSHCSTTNSSGTNTPIELN
ncbi:TBC1 domain family member 12 [Frankliniella fusca]|uniref:TBC1 domain family member 12 n=1 Tax=Frankliniella fusca TaxID=407009 RepID=A0AAE1HC69_9NEOP|nr:TBC1 domain family member 12 [Frankliniella fusca]